MGRSLFSFAFFLVDLCCAQVPASREASKSSADWVIDDCRVTYKGHLVPFGHGPREFVKLFGAASDSLIKPWPGHPPIRIYAWNRLGLNTEIWSDRHSDLFGGVTIYFRDHYGRSTKPTPERPSGWSSIEIKPYGLVDSNSVQSILSKGFHHSYALQGDEPSFLELDMDDGYWLSILPLRAMRGEFIGFSIHLMTPDSANVMTYPELLAQHGNACRTPDKKIPPRSESRKRPIPSGSGLEALRNLKQSSVNKVGNTLKSLLPQDSGKTMLESAKGFRQIPTQGEAMIASLTRPVLLVGLALLTLGEPSQAADWVIDRCQVTYKGTPVPLGMGLPEFTRLFGAPSDSFITPWPGNPGHAPVKTYYWDNMGMRTRFRSDAHTDLFGGVDLAFREPIRHPRMSKRRYPRGTTSIEFRPFGIVDANSIQKVLKEGFKPGHAPDAPESEFLDLDLGQAHGLALLQLKDDRGNFYGLSLRYSVPDGSKHSNYATAQGKMKANCRLP